MRLCYCSIIFLIYFKYFVRSLNCGAGDTDEIAKKLGIFGKFPGENISVFTDASRALHQSVQIGYNYVTGKRCLQVALTALDDNINVINSRIRNLQQLSDLKATLRDARETTVSIKIVYNTIKTYKIHKKVRTMRHEAVLKCRAHNPRDILLRLKAKAQNDPRLFDEIATGSKHTEVVFSNITSILVNEVALCAILAETCDKLLHPDGTDEIFLHFQTEVLDSLQAIHDELDDARRRLIARLDGSQVKDDIQKALDQAITMGFGWQKTADHVRNQLLTKYTFHAFAVIVYDRFEEVDGRVLAYEFNGNGSFKHDFGFYSVIVHAANKDRGCSDFANFIRNKRLRELFSNHGEFHAFLHEDMQQTVTSLREILQNKIFNDYFIGALSYRTSFAISFEEDEFHHFEHLEEPGTDEYSKSILIGWC